MPGVNSLFPGYVLIDYHSSHGPHKMILPTGIWDPTNITGVLGRFLAWNGSYRDAEAMIDNFVSLLPPFYIATTIIDSATIYTLASTTAPAIPQAGKSYGTPGTSVSTAWEKATQAHWTFRDTSYNLSGLTLLDLPLSAFDPTTTGLANAAEIAMIAAWTNVINSWSSRAGHRPQNFRKISYKLNDELRKRYGMV